ncbi:MAG: hypothetical protein JRI55_11395 [Deltaproteobacteria bacterium]|jgi:hypothetical protein|nr:hypothetical protein [Deltaproteobacteria bacterium]
MSRKRSLLPLVFTASLATIWSAACDDDGEEPGGQTATGGSATTSDAGSGGNGGTGGSDAGTGARPHPQYPALDLAELPGDGGGALGPYEPPALPDTDRTVTVSSTGTQAARDLEQACATPGTAVEVPDAAGRIGVVNIGDVDDCDVQLGADVIVDTLVVGSLPGPTHAPAHRIRVRGGQIGSMLVRGGSSDLVFDGVTVNNGVQPAASRNGTGMYLPSGDNPDDVVDRFVFVNSFIRMLPVDAGTGGDIDGTAYLSGNARNILFANNNIVTAGNRNSWGFRFSGGHNILLVDNTVRVSFHKLVRMNDEPVDYVAILGGTWMREATLTAGGALLNDSFAQLSGSTTDHVYVHDPVVYLLADASVSFGMTSDDVQAGRSWEARRIEWHALNDTVISDDILSTREGHCVAGASCDYGVGTHSYDYDAALTFPANPWRDLPTFDNDYPDSLPVVP